MCMNIYIPKATDPHLELITDPDELERYNVHQDSYFIEKTRRFFEHG